MNECKVSTTNMGVPTYQSLKRLDYRNKRQFTILHVHGQYVSRKMKLNGLKELASAYLSKRDVNVIFVQWDSHVRRGYRQNLTNTRIVATVATRFVEKLLQLSDPTWNKFHLVGYSLGAHIAGYIGKQIPNTIYRITALEAAQPGFENSDPRIRLHHTDAHFVDVLHTNARSFSVTLGLGYVNPIGDVDFYFNGGALQPTCFKHKSPQEVESLFWNFKKALFQTLEDFFECSHVIVNEYWKEALQSNCVMWGIRQKRTTNTMLPQQYSGWAEKNKTTKRSAHDEGDDDDNDDIKDCLSTESKCLPVGWRTFTKKFRGVFHVRTKSEKPYCIWSPSKKLG